MSKQIELNTDTMDAEWRCSLLPEVMKMFISKGKTIPRILIKDLKKAKKENKTGMGYKFDTTNKQNKKSIRVLYIEYKHLDKYYPKPLDIFTTNYSIQRGERAVNIENKYIRLIKRKENRKVFMYIDEVDDLTWLEEEDMKMIKKKGGSKSSYEKMEFQIGDCKWYGINHNNTGIVIDYGLTTLSNEVISGRNYVFDCEENRDKYYEYFTK